MAFRKGNISEEEYDAFVKTQTDEWIAWQEEVDFDVLVHGEFERNDMVEYFGENLSGYLFSKTVGYNPTVCVELNHQLSGVM